MKGYQLELNFDATENDNDNDDEEKPIYTNGSTHRGSKEFIEQMSQQNLFIQKEEDD
jgi:hypothetical protein